LDIISGFIIVIIMSLVFAAVLLQIGRSTAPPARQTGEGLEAYACGEDLEGGKVQFNLELFNFAMYFMLFDIIGFVLFLIWSNPGILVIVYLIVALVASLYVSLTPHK
jgi:NADH:ubiquinone oxidoreductase subunit 3 (subunit A)